MSTVSVITILCHLPGVRGASSGGHTPRVRETDSAGARLGWATVAFAELVSNLGYARDLVRGGQYLEQLQVGAFDVADLYRAAWVQAVSALDHWVHCELYDRASR